MRNSRSSASLVAVLMLGLAGCSDTPDSGAASPQAGAAGADLDRPSATLAALERRRSLIQDSNDIKRLQRAYGYYVDEVLWDEVAELFAEDGAHAEDAAGAR